MVVTNGTFIFTNVPGGPYKVTVSCGGFANWPTSVFMRGDQSISVLWFPAASLTGTVRSAETSAPLAGMTVSVNGRYATTTDGSGHYQLDAALDLGSDSILIVEGSGYDDDVHYIRSATQDARLHSAQRFTVGIPASIAVAPGDSLCSNNVQDPSFGEADYVCRTLHTTAPSDGVLTIDVVSASGTHFPLFVETSQHGGCCALNNPASISVNSGDEVRIDVELPSTTAAAESFRVTTSTASAGSPARR